MIHDKQLKFPSGFETDDAAKWFRRIERGLKRRRAESDQWKKNERYENMEHWDADDAGSRRDKVTINKIGAWVNSRIPTIMYRQPRFNVRPVRPEGYQPVPVLAMDPQTGQEQQKAVPKHRVIENLMNFIVSQPSFGFNRQLRRFVKASLIGYGCMKVGYAPEFEGEGDDVESVKDKWFVEWIPYWRMVIDPDGENEFYDHEWVACEYIESIEDVKNNSLFKNTEELEATLEEYDPEEYYRKSDIFTEVLTVHGEERADKVRLFEIIDLKNERIIVIAEGHGELLRDDPLPPGIDHSPYVFFRPQERMMEFYPRPPATDLIPINDEYNNYRSQVATGIRRAVRKFIMKRGALDEANIDKLMSPDDMAVAETDLPDIASVLAPVPIPGMNGEIFGYGSTIPRDFDEIAGQPGEARGAATAKTATQVNVMQGVGAVREDDLREIFAGALREIGKKLLDSIQANMTSEEAISIEGPDGQIFQTVVEHSAVVGDFDVGVDVSEMVPRNTDVEKAQFLEAMQIISSAPWLVIEPAMAEAVLDMFRIKSQPVRDGLIAAAQAQMQQAAGPPPGQGGQGGAPQDPAQMLAQMGGAGMMGG